MKRIQEQKNQQKQKTKKQENEFLKAEGSGIAITQAF